MNQDLYRPLKIEEKRILNRLLSANFPGRDKILQQISNCEVKEWSDGSRSLEFRTSSEAAANVIDRIPVEGRFGPNGVIQILLHVLEKKIKYLEFVTFHLDNIKKLPSPDEVSVIVKEKLQ